MDKPEMITDSPPCKHMADQVLPCPFCAHTAPRIFQSGGYWKVKCAGCGIAISGFPQKAIALEMWNRRPEPMKISGFSIGDYGFTPGPLHILNSLKDIELSVGDEIQISINGKVA